jgi:presenilin-like A22 family membrane protease
MKHNIKITAIILAMFVLTQFVGLYVVDSYAKEKVINGEIVDVNASKILPYGMEVPTVEAEYDTNFKSILISFVIAIGLLLILTHFKAKHVMKTWFFFVTVLALSISFTAFLPVSSYAPWIALALAIPLSVSKIYRRGLISHNFSELLIYPGIAAVFIPLINLKWAIVLLIIISIYDAWAVWKSGIMQKMAKFQMNEMKVLGGFMIPYASKKERAKIKKIKLKIKEKKMTEEQASKKNIKINMAILGGGDIIFPIITAGVVMKTWGFWPAVGIIAGALVGLTTLLAFSEKKKFYPAMPFISAGIFLAMGITWLLM